MVPGMAFTGSPVIKQVSDRMVRITGLSLAAGESGQIGLHGGEALSDILGVAASFGVLAKTYINDLVGTSINGDLGYITPPAEDPTVSGATHVNDATYLAAVGAYQTALVDLIALPATFTFAVGNVNLSTDTTHGAAGVFGPGVYDIDGDVITTTAPITLTGGGLYVFRCTGSFTVVNGSTVQCAGGASPNDVWWIPAEGTSIGDESAFVGNVAPSVQPVDISVQADVAWEGRAFTAFPHSLGGEVTTITDTITVPSSPGATVRLPAAFLCSPYTYDGHVVELQDSIRCSVENGEASGAVQAPISVVKTGSTVDDFVITLTNNSGSVDSPDQEIVVRFHS